MRDLYGYKWFADEKFEVESDLDKKVKKRLVGKVRAVLPPSDPLLIIFANFRKKNMQDIVFYKIVERLPPE